MRKIWAFAKFWEGLKDKAKFFDVSSSRNSMLGMANTCTRTTILPSCTSADIVEWSQSWLLVTQSLDRASKPQWPRLRPARRQSWHSRGNPLSISYLGNITDISSPGKTRVGIISYPTCTLAHWNGKLVKRAAIHAVEWASKGCFWLEDSILDKLPWTAEKVTSNHHHWTPTAPPLLSKSRRGKKVGANKYCHY